GPHPDAATPGGIAPCYPTERDATSSVRPQPRDAGPVAPGSLNSRPTGTRTSLFVVVPLPSSPPPLSPQQYAAPPGVRPHVKPMAPVPTLIAAKVSSPDTAAGTVLQGKSSQNCGPPAGPVPSWSNWL